MITRTEYKSILRPFVTRLYEGLNALGYATTSEECHTSLYLRLRERGDGLYVLSAYFTPNESEEVVGADIDFSAPDDDTAAFLELAADELVDRVREVFGGRD